MTFRIAQLDFAHSTAFVPFTYERYRRIVRGGIQTTKYVAFGAWSGWIPIGLALAYFNESEARLLSLTVHPNYRNQGVATHLVAHLENALRERGAKKFYADYIGDNPSLESVFAKCGWDAPTVHSIAVMSDIPTITPSPIYQTPVVYPDGFEPFLWVNLTDSDRDYIKNREAQAGGWYSAQKNTVGSVNPFLEAVEIDEASSVGVRYHGDVVGWMVVHKMTANDLHFAVLFVSPEYRGMSLGLLLVMDAVQRACDHYRATQGNINAHWQFNISNPVMKLMVDTYLLPYAVTVRDEKQVTKRLE